MFIGLPIDKKMKQSARVWQERYQLAKYYKKTVAADDFHITLLFLGSWNEQKRVKLWEELKHKIAPSYSTISLKFNHIEIFGSIKNPSVFHVMPDKEPSLYQMQQLIVQEAALLDFPVETRPYLPHLTLAKKWKNPEQIKPKNWEFPLRIEEQYCRINQICLYQINPSEQPMYQVVSSIQLSK